MIVKTYPHGNHTILKLHIEIDASGCIVGFDGVEEIKLSQEIDPVFFYGELLALSRSGISTFEEFVKSAEKVGPEVKKESNRLYLLYRSFGDGSGVEKS